jgi:multidrug efflux pump subunit AcrA (membrane-fusion protein)
VMGVVLAGVGGAGALVPLPHTIKGRYTLAPISSVALKAPRAGMLAKVQVAAGTPVEAGAVLANYELVSSEQHRQEAEAELAAIEAKRKVLETPANKKLQALVEKAELTQQAAAQAVTKAEGATPHNAALLAGLKKHLAAADAAVAKAKKLAGPSTLELDAQGAAAQKRLDDAKAELARATIVAPSAGVVGALTIKAGDAVTADGAIGTLDDVSKLKATITVEGETLATGAETTLFFGQTPMKTTLGTATAQQGESTLDNAKRTLTAGTTGLADIQGAPRALVRF